VSAKWWVAGVVLAGGVAVFATQGHSQKHYSDVPGQGLTIERQSLPALDDAKGGAPNVAPSAAQPKDHIGANHVGVEAPAPAPPLVAAGRDPAPTTNTATGHTPGDATTPGASGGSGSLLPNLTLLQNLGLPLTCDATCLANYLHLPVASLPSLPVTLPTGTVPTP
jgi:hypothetical protein